MPALKKMRKLEFDGSGDFIMANTSCFTKFQQDPYFLSDVFPDEQRFIDWDSAFYSIGWEEVYIKDGRVVDLPYGDYAPPAGNN
jgi:hypothetical protein